MPTDSGVFRSQFCGREIVNAVLIVGGVAFEKAAHAASHSARTPPERHAPAASPSVLGSAFLQPGSANGRLALQTIENRVRPSERIGQFLI